MRLIKLAAKLLETYSLSELMEMNDLSEEIIIYILLEAGLIDPDAPAILDLDVATD